MPSTRPAMTHASPLSCDCRNMYMYSAQNNVTCGFVIIFINKLQFVLFSVSFQTNRQKITAFIRRSKRTGFRSSQLEQLFSKIVSGANNVLHTLLPPLSTASQHYSLRRRTHTYSLPGHDSYLCDCNFITRMLYKDSY